MATIDDDTAAQIQSFTSWAQGRGYHVIGALIGPKEEPRVKVFATSPEGDHKHQVDHVKKLLEIVTLSITKGSSEGMLNLPLATN